MKNKGISAVFQNISRRMSPEYGMVQYCTDSTEEPSVQRVKRSKGLNVIEVHSGLGHLKNISHPSLFPEEGPSCFSL